MGHPTKEHTPLPQFLGASCEYRPYQSGELLYEGITPDDVVRPDGFEEKLVQLDRSFDDMNFDIPEKLEQELVQTELLTDPLTGKRLGVKKLNWVEGSDEDKNLALILPQFSVHGDHEGYSREIAAIAAINPDVPIIFADNPGVGRSDALDRESLGYMKQSGDFGPTGEFISRCLNKAGIKPRHLFGISQGGRGVMAAARFLNNDISSITIVDIPGVVDMSASEMRERFGNLEGERKKVYMEESEDETAKEIDKGSDSILGLAKFVIGYATNSSLRGYANAMRRGPIVNSHIYGCPGSRYDPSREIKNILRSNSSARLNYVMATASAVAPVKEALRAGFVGPEMFSERVNIALMPGATHAFSNGNAASVARLFKHFVK